MLPLTRSRTQRLPVPLGCAEDEDAIVVVVPLALRLSATVVEFEANSRP